MTWRPIAESGVAFTYSQLRGAPTLAGSTVSASTEDGPAWSISFDDNVARNVRITVQDYSSQRQQLSEDPSYFEFFTGEEPSITVVNEILEDASEFVPNPVTGSGDRFGYQAGAGSEQFRIESFSMTVEVDVVASPTIRPILQTFRGYRGADSAFRTWIRTDEGRSDLSAATVTVRVYAYDSRTMLVELPATADALGMVDFTLPQATANRQLPGNLFRMELVMAVNGGVQLAQLGILELMG